MSSHATPLLDALVAPGDSAAARGWFDTLLTILGCLIPISVCLYLADLQPLFAIGNVQFIHADLVVVCVALAVLSRALLRGFHSFPRVFFLPLLLLFLSTLLSALFAVDSLRASAALIQIVEFGALSWCFSLVTSGRSFLRILHCMLGWFVFETVVATVQFIAGDPSPHGTLMVHQQYAMFTGFSAVIAFALLCAECDRKNKLAYLLILLVLIWGTLLGQERAPWLAFVLAGAAVAYYERKRRVKTLLTLSTTLLCAVLLLVAATPLRDMTTSRLSEVQNTTERTNSLLGRLALWTAAGNLFLEHPILGVGPKNFLSLAPSILTRDEMGGEDALDPHNVWIGMLAEQGLIGFITYAGFCWAVFALAARPLRQSLSPSIRVLCLAYLAYHSFWFVMSLSYFGKGAGHIHFMMIGLMLGLSRRMVGSNRAQCSSPVLSES
jgi:O-antigen ligase